VLVPIDFVLFSTIGASTYYPLSGNQRVRYSGDVNVLLVGTYSWCKGWVLGLTVGARVGCWDLQLVHGLGVDLQWPSSPPQE